MDKQQQKEIELLRKHGFNPIAATKIFFEYTYIFETDEEALSAYEQFEKKYQGMGCIDRDDNCIIAFWYGIDNFHKTLKDTMKERSYKELEVIYLNNEIKK